MENNTDEGAQDIPVQKTDTNLSFHVIAEDKTDMVEKIHSSIEKITNMMTDNYVHALANITGTVIKSNDIDPSIRQNMFSQIKSKLLSCDMDVRALHGQRFKIFAKWLHIVLPKSKITQKSRDEIILTSQNKLRKIIDELFTDHTFLQDMSKVTGIFLPIGAMIETTRKAVLRNIILKLEKK
jgi:hypothetical protein